MCAHLDFLHIIFKLVVSFKFLLLLFYNLIIAQESAKRVNWKRCILKINVKGMECECLQYIIRNKPSQHVCNNSSVTSQFNNIKDNISNEIRK